MTRPIRIEGSIAYIPLTKGYEAIIDAADAHLVERFNWCAHVKGNTVYAARNTPRDSKGKQKTIELHCAIMAAPAGTKVDHRDGNGLQCRRFNLRLATHAQNMQNQRTPRNNKSGVKGVSWHSRAKKWQVHISHNGKRNYLGLSDTLEAAATAYHKASAEYHGEFGRAV